MQTIHPVSIPEPSRETTQESRALRLVEEHGENIRKIAEVFSVPSSDGRKTYTVTYGTIESCSCIDYQVNGSPCKHLLSVGIQYARWQMAPKPTKPKQCAGIGCEREVYVRGYCQKHYARLRRHGDPEYTAPGGRKQVTSMCSIEGCEGKHQARGYCNKHYLQWRLHGDPLHAKRPHTTPRMKNEGPCSMAECEKPARTRGLCGAHYVRLLKHGDPTYRVLEDNRGRSCSEEGCSTKASSRGLCVKHYEAWRKVNAAPCSVEGCETGAHAHGLCHRHYNRQRQYDSPEYAEYSGAIDIDRIAGSKMRERAIQESA